MYKYGSLYRPMALAIHAWTGELSDAILSLDAASFHDTQRICAKVRRLKPVYIIPDFPVDNICFERERATCWYIADSVCEATLTSLLERSIRRISRALIGLVHHLDCMQFLMPLMEYRTALQKGIYHSGMVY